jgi:protease IV
MSKSTKWFLTILGILADIVIGFTVIMIYLVSDSGEGVEAVSIGSGDKIAIVEIRGVINSSEDIVRQIKKYREQHGVMAILVRMDTPGGGVVAGQEIYEELRKTRDSGKPVVVSMGSLAASAGYYISCGSSRIVANRGTLTGSIGVISEFLQLEDLLGKIGVGVKTIKSGKLKDIGSPTRKMTATEERYYQDLINEVYLQFVGVVECERDLDHEDVLAIADGRVFTGEKAVELGLVDTIGTYEDAIEITAALAGIHGKPALVRERKRTGLLDGLTGKVAESLTTLKQDLIERPVLSYRFAAPQ